MSLEDQLTAKMKEAMKAGDKPRLMGLRALKSALTQERTRHAGPFTEEAALKVIASYRKKMSQAREQYADAGREELAAQADLELALCDEFLPPQLSEEELRRLVEERIAAVGATSPADLGRVMGPLMKELAGRADGNLVRRLVQETLGG
ncbi:MAG TPA: GatB/YqeY domain-containing protein [Bacteroidetes bacterium]|nr:GatB/YqeY domain-containing protein [Bacteroidota bacterium]